MKTIVLALLAISTLITSCDRDTLNGLKVKIDAEVKSEYDEGSNSSETVTEKNTSVETQTTTKVETEESNSNQVTAKEDKTETESVVSNSTKKVSKESDPDAPMAFNKITDCSDAGIRAKTNEAFYAKNSQVKSIDSKNKEQVKAWKKIYKKFEAKCQ